MLTRILVIGLIGCAATARAQVGNTVQDNDNNGQLAAACAAITDAEKRALVDEFPSTRTTLSGGLAVGASGHDGYHNAGVDIHAEREWLAKRPLFARVAVDAIWLGRIGGTAEAAIGWTVHHDYDAFYRASSDWRTTTVYDNGAIVSGTEHVPAFCMVARRDIHLFTGVRLGGFLGTTVTDSTTGMTNHVGADGWAAIELGVTDSQHYPKGHYRDDTLALLYDPTNGGRFGLYLRRYASLFGRFYAGGDLTLLGGGSYSQLIVTANWGVHLE